MPFALGPKATAGSYRLAAYETIGSTSTEALNRAKAGDEGRLWVVAKAQTAGHGRRGRAWETPSGNLAASLLVGSVLGQPNAAKLGFAAGLALDQAIRALLSGSSAFSIEDRSSSNPLILRRGSDAVGIASKGRPECAGNASLRASRLAFGSHLSMREGGSSPHAETTAELMEHRGSFQLRLKWPNDVLVDGAKIAGILLEALTLPDGVSRVVIGIGVNVLHAPKDLPYPATSLCGCGVEVTPEALFEALAEAWVQQEALWDGGQGFPAIRNRWLERAAGLGAPIVVHMGEQVFRGLFETIDEEGRLIVRAADGSAQPITAGDVHFGAAATMRN